MGRHYNFIAGSFYRKDDISGFPQHAEKTQKMWNNLYATGTIWNPRQPQDLVKGVKDNQSVLDARPLPPDQFAGPVYIQLSESAAIGATHIYVESLVGLRVGTTVGIMMDTGVLFQALLISIDAGGEFITIGSPLPRPAASGNLLVCYEVVT